MDIKEVEQVVRRAIKTRQEAWVPVRNGVMALNSKVRSQPGWYWEPEHPNHPLCILGAIGATGCYGAARMLSITVEEAWLLEAGFEHYERTSESVTASPFWQLGRLIGKELEDQLEVELLAKEREVQA